MKVLVTRSEPDASDFADLCRAHGLDPIIAQVMEIRIHEKRVDLAGAGALAFTSANGVRAFAANETRRDLPVFAVGAVTADAAKAAGFKNVNAADGDVESLAHHIGAERDKAAKGVLHIAGEDRAGDLVALLRAAGIGAHRLTLYEAASLKALPDEVVRLLKNDPPEWVTFFSPRTARLFVELAEAVNAASRFGDMRAACLSDAVAEAAGNNWRERRVAPERSAESLVRLIAANGGAHA
jgi:uroporphyrinogen-III synthase